MLFLHGGAIVTACKALGLAIPRAPRPRRTVMSSPHACTLCYTYTQKCSQLYVDHCWGWITCPACRHKAHLGETRYLQSEGCVMVDTALPRLHSIYDVARAHAMPVEFYRRSAGAVQRAWLAPWLQRGFLYVVRGEVLLLCHFHGSGHPPPEGCQYTRGVSAANLALHNHGPALADLVRTVLRRLYVSDKYEASVRRRWCRALRLQYAQGLALRAVQRALLARGVPGAVLDAHVWGCVLGL